MSRPARPGAVRSRGAHPRTEVDLLPGPHPQRRHRVSHAASSTNWCGVNEFGNDRVVERSLAVYVGTGVARNEARRRGQHDPHRPRSRVHPPNASTVRPAGSVDFFSARTPAIAGAFTGLPGQRRGRLQERSTAQSRARPSDRDDLPTLVYTLCRATLRPPEPFGRLGPGGGGGRDSNAGTPPNTLLGTPGATIP